MSANTTPLPKTVLVAGEAFPRRNCMDARHPTEQRIAQAEEYVEAMGADPLLTDALVKLQEARALVADWLEGGQKPEPRRVLTLAEQFAVLRLRYPQATMVRGASHKSGGQLVTIPDFPLPEGYDRTTCTVYFEVPDGYPYVAPSHFFTSELRLAVSDWSGHEPFMSRPLTRSEDLGGRVPPEGTMVWFWQVQAWDIWQYGLRTYASVIAARLNDVHAGRRAP